jgi:hypothetical protein
MPNVFKISAYLGPRFDRKPKAQVVNIEVQTGHQQLERGLFAFLTSILGAAVSHFVRIRVGAVLLRSAGPTVG